MRESPRTSPWDEPHWRMNTHWHFIDMKQHVGQDMPELKPVETGPLPIPTTGCASLAEEAGTMRLAIEAGSPRHSVVGGCHRPNLLTIESNPGSPRNQSNLGSTFTQAS